MSADSSATPDPLDAVDVFELGAEHEQVVFCNDPSSGLRSIIALHSTALGPGLGGTRFFPYASTADAVRDVLNLSRGMTYKTRWPASTSVAARRSSSVTPTATSPRPCCGPTAASSSRSTVATSPPAMSAPTPPTWTSSPGSATS